MLSDVQLAHQDKAVQYLLGSEISILPWLPDPVIHVLYFTLVVNCNGGKRTWSVRMSQKRHKMMSNSKQMMQMLHILK